MCTVLLPPGDSPFAVNYIIIIIIIILFMCKYVLYYCHRVTAHLQLNIIIIILFV
jgi:hypothetical protein